MFRPVVICPLVVTVGLASHAAAQAPTDGQLRGTVWDATRAVIADAAVVVSSPQLIGGARTLVSGADGQWRAAALPPGEYAVSVSASGFTASTVDRLRLLPGATLTVDMELSVAAQSAQARVEAARPAVDVTTAAVTYTAGEQLLRGLPTSRTFSDLLNLFPGVAGDQALGGSKSSNGLVVDGVDTTEASEQGPWLRVTQNWLQEVQGVGLGADAQYGLSTGLTAFGTTRSGTNRYSGLAEGWANPSSWVAVNTRALSQSLQRQFTSARVEAYWNANAQLGGPLRIDRLWFFAGVDHTTNDGAPAGYNGADMQRERDTRGITKLTWKAWPAGLVEGFLQAGRRRVRNFGLSLTTPSEAAAEFRQPQVMGTVRVQHTASDALLLEAAYSGSRSPGITAPQAPGSLDGPPGHLDQVTGAYSVNLLFHSRDDRWRNSVSASATWFGRLGGVTHELKFGLQGERAHEQTTSGYPGGLAYLDENGAPSRVQYNEGFGTTSLRGDTSRLTAYVQDRFQLGARLTVSPGVRIDRFGWSSSGASEVLSTHPLSPRLGLAWDVRRDHRTVIRAHVGRYTDPAFSQPILVADTNRPLQILARVVAPGVFEEIQRTDFRTRVVDDEIRHSYVDQFVGGVEHQLFGGLTVLGQYIHREFRDFSAVMPMNVSWTPVLRQDPGPDGTLGTSDDGGVFTVFSRVINGGGPLFQIYTTLDNGWRQYRGGQLVVRTTAAGPWQLQASYTRSQTRGTVTTGLHANAGVRLFHAANPNRLINGDDLTPFDPTNEAKVLAVWSPRRHGGWVASGVYRYLTGAAWGRVFIATGLPQGSEAIRVEPRGTRRLPAINQLDLHLEKAVSIRGRHLSSFVDVFNVSNQGVPDSESGDVITAASGPNLGVPTRWRLPRQGRVGLRLTF